MKVRFKYWGIFGDGHTEELKVINGYGVLDKKAEYVFTAGQCHSLALALHKLTGWEIRGFGVGPYNEPHHCAVYCPELKRYVDIDGDWVVPRWKDTGSLTREKIRGFATYFPACPTKAMPFARSVLRKLNKKLVKEGFNPVAV